MDSMMAIQLVKGRGNLSDLIATIVLAIRLSPPWGQCGDRVSPHGTTLLHSLPLGGTGGIRGRDDGTSALKNAETTLDLDLPDACPDIGRWDSTPTLVGKRKGGTRHGLQSIWMTQSGEADDRKNYKQLVETTVEIANKVGVADIVGRIVEDLKDGSEPYRRMVMETIAKVAANLGASDIDARLEDLLIDGSLYAFQEQTSDDANVMLNGFGAVVNQAADLISRVAVVMKQCHEEQLMDHIGIVLHEYLGEEYPEVLGSILRALKAIVNVIDMTKMTPPIKDLLPRLTPILKNRHEKMQENCVDLVGRIADRGAEFVSARDLMKICFELLEMIEAHKKGIRRATVNTFGVSEPNVQNGVLKSLSFLFEYIGDMGKDHLYAVTPLLEDAFMERDLVHRQTAASVVKHIALGVAGLGCKDALVPLLNYVWPNVFETSPHVINSVFEASEGMRVALGPEILLLLSRGSIPSCPEG
ncbi:hypothetical protein SLEP1_g11027 [Rubroshorea leprosula]|uniref:Splicing factor 3B subunit 1 n=1 Tax=Rubroshorea leprosula TaxID=152421 RepID=A0AAV5IA06_9ROSI|nr:hypothetical protein SLEP1_g11027 [Rubroshorea leprosula]